MSEIINVHDPINGTFVIRQNLCIGCTLCELICPWGSAHEDPNNPGKWMIDQDGPNKCTGCSACTYECPMIRPDAIVPSWEA